MKIVLTFFYSFFLVLYHCYGYMASFKILSTSRYSRLNRINIYIYIYIILYSIKTNIHHIVCQTILSSHLMTYFYCSVMHALKLDWREWRMNLINGSKQI
jgi:hypothetical protein